MATAWEPPDEEARFARALDDCCRRVRAGEPLEPCLTDYPADMHDELARLVPLAVRLPALGRDPSPAFEQRLERNLLAAVGVQRRAQRGGVRADVQSFLAGASPARLAALALVVLLVLGGGSAGIVSASDGSLPDSPLYQVKIAREWAERTLARTGEARVDVHARQVVQRGRELGWAVADRKPRRVVEVLAVRLAWSTERAVDQALALRAAGRPLPALRALAALRLMEREVARLAERAEPDAQLSLLRLQVLLQVQERRLAPGGTT
jgi:hypothetical protein